MLDDAHDTMHLECQAQICDACFVHHNDVLQVNDEATACTTAQQTQQQQQVARGSVPDVGPTYILGTIQWH